MVKIFIDSWLSYENLVFSVKKLPVQYSEDSENYFLYAAEAGMYVWETSLEKGTSDSLSFESLYKSSCNLPLEKFDSSLGSSYQYVAPFSAPIFKIKYDACSDWVTCPSDSTTAIDFALNDTFYSNGGQILYKDSKEGDYIRAEVYDLDSIIPSESRASLCESWPVVSEYIKKRWILPVSGYSEYKLDTRPMSAEVSNGLYLRVYYCASSEAGDRKIAINYDLSKELI